MSEGESSTRCSRYISGAEPFKVRAGTLYDQKPLCNTAYYCLPLPIAATSHSSPSHTSPELLQNAVAHARCLHILSFTHIPLHFPCIPPQEQSPYWLRSPAESPYRVPTAATVQRCSSSESLSLPHRPRVHYQCVSGCSALSFVFAFKSYTRFGSRKFHRFRPFIGVRRVFGDQFICSQARFWRSSSQIQLVQRSYLNCVQKFRISRFLRGTSRSSPL